jgi:hypothetical protein
MTRHGLFCGALLGLALAGPAQAVPLDPNDFGSLGALTGAAISLDTSALTFNGGAGGVLVAQGGGLPDIAVFVFDGGSVLGDVAVSGGNPLAILFQGSATVTGTIDISGGTGGAGGGNTVGARGLGVAGGFSGGAGGPFTVENGFGPGGGTQGGSSASNSGTGPGAGGAFGTDGGDGGAGVTTKPGGVAYGDPLRDALQGGSGGGGGGGRCCVGASFEGGSGGGAGGGALELGALELLELVGAQIFANGGDGGTGYRNGGGGSGGGLFLHAFDVSLDAATLLQANGGSGGTGGSIGGCGGAGRIELTTNTGGSLNNAGTVETVGFGDCADGVVVTSSLADIGEPTDNGDPGGSTEVPAPAPVGLLGLAVIGLLALRRGRMA